MKYSLRERIHSVNMLQAHCVLLKPYDDLLAGHFLPLEHLQALEDRLKPPIQDSKRVWFQLTLIDKSLYALVTSNAPHTQLRIVRLTITVSQRNSFSCNHLAHDKLSLDQLALLLRRILIRFQSHIFSTCATHGLVTKG